MLNRSVKLLDHGTRAISEGRSWVSALAARSNVVDADNCFHVLGVKFPGPGTASLKAIVKAVVEHKDVSLLRKQRYLEVREYTIFEEVDALHTCYECRSTAHLSESAVCIEQCVRREELESGYENDAGALRAEVFFGGLSIVSTQSTSSGTVAQALRFNADTERDIMPSLGENMWCRE